MPDISDKKKEQIRVIARKYCSILSQVPFEEGVLLYSKTFQNLFISSARWRICLLCGEIESPEFFKSSKHKCKSHFPYDFPIIVKTSWMKLESFFLSKVVLS